jgi:hypothetical protein
MGWPFALENALSGRYHDDITAQARHYQTYPFSMEIAIFI